MLLKDIQYALSFVTWGIVLSGLQTEIQDYVLASLPIIKPGNPYLNRFKGVDVSQPQEIDLDTSVDLTAISHSASRPKFHLLIPAEESSISVCRTLVSAAVLGYPPPTLIGYEAKNPTNIIESIARWLHTKNAGDDDLVLVTDSHTWFQLPAQIMVDRFSTFLQQSDAELKKKYGAEAKGIGAVHEQKYWSRVVFPASKRCELRNNATMGSGPSILCDAVPQSLLPKDIYGDKTDKLVDAKEVRPRFLEGNTHIGSVRDLRSLYAAAYAALDEGNSTPETVFSTLYSAQSLARQKVRHDGLSFLEKIRSEPSSAKQSVLSNMLSDHTPNIEMKTADHYGITLDYRSDIFKSMALSADDIRPLSFNKPVFVASPSRLAVKSFIVPLQLPADLNNTSGPFNLLPIPTVGEVSNDPWLELDRLPLHKTWREVNLLTNIAVPWSSVPASLNLNPALTTSAAESSNETMAGFTVEEVEQVMWPHTWFAAHARALMRRYLRSATGHVGAVEADNGGENWWDLRGGVGGVWTDNAVFMEWSDVCGSHDMAVFGDGLGELGREEGKGPGMLGQKIDKWGKTWEDKRELEKKKAEDQKKAEEEEKDDDDEDEDED